MSPEEFQRAIVTIDKEQLVNLPQAVYKGRIVLVDNMLKLEDAIQDLKKEKIIGFDTETRPSFKKGVQYEVALIQLSTPAICYLFRTNVIGFPQEIIDIIQDPEITKVGLSIHDDFHSLRKVTEIDPQGFIDLQQYVKEFKIADNSLSRVYGILFGERISKGQRLTNWESVELTPAQQSYAALDAYACLRIYEYLKEGKFNPIESEYLSFPPSSDPETNEENIQ